MLSVGVGGARALSELSTLHTFKLRDDTNDYGDGCYFWRTENTEMVEHSNIFFRDRREGNTPNYIQAVTIQPQNFPRLDSKIRVITFGPYVNLTSNGVSSY